MRYLPAYTALALTVASGLVHGFWTDRWVVSPGPAEAAARLARLPPDAGDWHATTLHEKSRGTEALAGHLTRRYVNRSTGRVVTVALAVGLPGPVSIHTPDVCYKAGGFDVAAPARYRHPARAGRPAAQFWTADLRKERTTEHVHQRIYWAWDAGEGWTAPDNPRWRFAGRPVLAKLYLVREVRGPDERREDDPCLDLMNQLLPQLRETLNLRP